MKCGVKVSLSFELPQNIVLRRFFLRKKKDIIYSVFGFRLFQLSFIFHSFEFISGKSKILTFVHSNISKYHKVTLIFKFSFIFHNFSICHSSKAARWSHPCPKFCGHVLSKLVSLSSSSFSHHFLFLYSHIVSAFFIFTSL